MTMLHPAGSRFPLTRGRIRLAAEAETTDQPMGKQRPFGLRFFLPQATPSPQPAFGYCANQQVTVDDEGRPVAGGPAAAWNRTTTGIMDGNEETMMDQDPDSN